MNTGGVKNRKETLKRVMGYVGRYKWLMLLSLFLAAAVVVLTLYIPILIGAAVDCIIGAGKVDFPGLMLILRKMAVVIGATALFQWLMNAMNNHVTYQVVRDMRVKAFERLQQMPLAYIDSHDHGEVLSRIITDVDQFSDGLLMGFTQVFTGILTIGGTLLFMFLINPWIAAIVVLLTPLSFLVAGFIARRTFAMFKAQSEARGEITSLINEILEQEKVVQAFSYEEEAEKRFDGINEELGVCSRKAIFYSSLTNPATRFVNGLVYAAVGVAGAYAAISGLLSVGQLTSFLNYANQYTKPFNEISGVVTEFQNALASAARVFELIDEKTEILDKEGAAVLAEAEGNVELLQVDFSYSPDVALIEDLNLSVRPGQRVAIVGPTGCGKSTLINLLMRFYDVDKGSIRVDGVDIRDMTRHSLRANYGMVLQETWLKSVSIRDNIAYGRPDATEEDVVRAAKEAHAHRFIERMPDGYDTVISEDGGNLSQGQKQLLCIARVMLSLPPMLILDEATSSIDTRTELMIQQTFAEMMRGRTSFVVAHRLSTIREADVILVMEKGHIIEQGSHEELLDKKGFYYRLYNSQFAAS